MEEDTKNKGIEETSSNEEKTSPEPILSELEGVEGNNKETTNQVSEKTPPELRNPTGKGGFGDNPQNRSDGRWSKENSFTYWLNYFKHLTVTEFEQYKVNKPKSERTVAEQLAYNRVAKATDELKEFQEVANRTEGKPKETMQLSGLDGEPIRTVNEVSWKIIKGDE